MSSSSPDLPATPLATLIPAGEGSEAIRIETPVVRIGQGPRNDVVLDDDTVSTAHARLEYDSGAWRLVDLGSRNGTFVDGVRLTAEVPTPLNEGAALAFGLVELHFSAAAEADPESARASYVPPATETRSTERTTFRLPVWLLALIIVIVAILVAMYFFFSGDPQPVTDAVPTAFLGQVPTGPGQLAA